MVGIRDFDHLLYLFLLHLGVQIMVFIEKQSKFLRADLTVAVTIQHPESTHNILFFKDFQIFQATTHKLGICYYPVFI